MTGPTASTWPIASSGFVKARDPFPPDEELYSTAVAMCGPVMNAPYPVSEAPTRAELAELASCDAEALYYGIGVPVDYERARKCAFTMQDPPQGAVMGGAEILMMVYANGRGVPQNFELALRFACLSGGAPAEVDGRLHRLLAARAKGSLDGVMDLCDEVVSGYMSGYCAAHRERIASVPRHARRMAATASMPQAELKALDVAAAHFFETRETWEVDLSGSARARFGIEERAKLEDELVAMLERLQNPKFAPAKAHPRPREQELAKVMSQIAATKDNPDMPPGFITHDGIIKTQKQWLRYRDALIALVRKVRPAAELDAWRATIIEARLKQLSE